MPTAIQRVAPSTNHPVIVIDPGHSPSISHVDPATGLNDSDYENEPEMRDVFAVALLSEAKLEAAGYKVVMTKNSVDDRVSLGERAAVANNAHAALAISIHDQAGANGGIGFTQGNNIVYYQSVGTYRATPAGKKIYFTDAAVAAASKKYGAVFQAARAAAQGATIRLQANVGYDLGTRNLPAGNIWMVQLLSKVPWVYNEAGGNSAGTVGLDASDKQKYADGLVASIERCVPISR
jgi:N-acetylmuramoyl-L-alanine amidase